MKYLKLLLFIFCFATACEQESINSKEENVVSPSVDVAELEIRPATDSEIAELKKKYNLTVLGGKGEKMGASRWSDDLSGSTYGTVSCDGGQCGVVTGGSKIGIGCFDGNGDIISSGAYRQPIQ